MLFHDNYDDFAALKEQPHSNHNSNLRDLTVHRKHKKNASVKWNFFSTIEL